MMPVDPGLVPVFFITLAVLSLLTIPLAACILFAAILLLWLNPAPLPPDFLLNYSLAIRLNSPALISIPLFALAGELAVAAGITERLLDIADAIGGRGRHAVGMRTILGCTLFACVSGVGPVAVTAEGRRLIPAMLRAGYSRRTAAGAIACAAGLSIVIPASVPLTVYAASVGIATNVVFTASFVPGLILAVALLFAMLAHAHFRRGGEEPRREPSEPAVSVLWRARWALPLPVLLLTSLFTGFLTAPEAAASACLYAILVGRLSGNRMSWSEVHTALDRAATVSATVLIMAGMGSLLAMLMNSCGFTERMANFLFMACGGSGGAIIAINGIFLVFGCFLDMPALITMVAPLFLPLAARCGLSPAHFGVIVVMNIAVGLVTPPQAWNIAAAAKTAGLDEWSAARGALPFIAAMLGVLALVSHCSALSLWLPGLFGWEV